MVTASHLPNDRNGMKFFARRSHSNSNNKQQQQQQPNVVGGLLEQDIDQIVDLAAHIFDDQKGTYPNIDLPTNRAPHHKPWQESHAFLRQVYGAHLATLIRNTAANGINFDTPLQGMKIVVNPGNGAGGFFLEVLQSCGADTSGSFNVEPDGHFPNCTPNPEDPQTMADTVKAVKQQGADLGIIFDPDCDRIGLVQGGAEPLELNRNRLIAMAAAVVLRDHPGTTIVTDSVTSEGLGRFIARRGGNHLRYMKGYRNVIEEAQRLNDEEGIDCQLAMECSGHAAFKENRFLDDGAFLAVKLLGEMASPFSSTPSGTVKNTQTKDLRALIADLEEPAEFVELRLKVREGHQREVVTEHILKAFYWVCDVTSWWKMEKDNHEGLRAKVQEDGGRKSGWLHFRPSLHDPVVALTCESEMEGGIGAMLETLIDAGMMKATEEEVDWSAVMEYMSRWHREKKQRQQQQQMHQQ
jgi:phosphomannomutase